MRVAAVKLAYSTSVWHQVQPLRPYPWRRSATAKRLTANSNLHSDLLMWVLAATHHLLHLHHFAAQGVQRGNLGVIHNSRKMQAILEHHVLHVNGVAGARGQQLCRQLRYLAPSSNPLALSFICSCFLVASLNGRAMYAGCSPSVLGRYRTMSLNTL